MKRLLALLSAPLVLLLMVDRGAGQIETVGGLTSASVTNTVTNLITSSLTNFIHTNVLWVTKNGNDTTGTPGQPARPYLTISNAVQAGVKPAIVKVAPGVYNESVILRDGIHLEMASGVIVSQSVAALPVFFDNGSAATVSLSGDAVVIHTGAGFSGGGLLLTGNSTVSIDRMEVRAVANIGVLTSGGSPTITYRGKVFGKEGGIIIGNGSLNFVGEAYGTNDYGCRVSDALSSNYLSGFFYSQLNSAVHCGGGYTLVENAFCVSIDNVFGWAVEQSGGPVTVRNSILQPSKQEAIGKYGSELMIVDGCQLFGGTNSTYSIDNDGNGSHGSLIIVGTYANKTANPAMNIIAGGLQVSNVFQNKQEFILSAATKTNMVLATNGTVSIPNTNLVGGLVVTQDIRFLGHNSASNSVWVCTNATTGEGEWRTATSFAGGGGLAFDPATNIFNIQYEPVRGSTWYAGTNGTPTTNQARAGMEFSPFWRSLRMGEVAGGGDIYGLVGNGSNYWNNTNVGPLTVGLGSNAYVKAAYSSVLGGRNNYILTNAENSMIGGGIDNLIDTNAVNSVIGGGGRNSIRSTNTGSPSTLPIAHVTISGGSNNNVLGLSKWSTIGGGGDNTIIAVQEATIAGGFGNTIQPDGKMGFLGGGANNSIGVSGGTPADSQWATLCGGNQNNVRGDYSFIGGGLQNQIFTGGDYAMIGGGQLNVIGVTPNNFSTHATIGGGSSGLIQQNSHWSVIGGGLRNQILSGSTNSTIAGGEDNVIQANAPLSTILGGRDNTITGTGDFGLIIGISNQVSAANAFAIGRTITNTLASSVLLGSFDTKFRVGVAGHSNSWVGGVMWKESATLYTNLNAASTLSNLATVPIPANQLTNTGDTLDAEWGIKLQNSKENTNQFQIFYGSATLLDTTLIIISNTSVRAGCTIVRNSGANSQHVEAWLTSGSNHVFHANIEIAETNGIATTLGMKGGARAEGAHTNNYFRVKWEPASQ